MLQSFELPGTSTPRAMQGDGLVPQMTETTHSRPRAAFSRRPFARWLSWRGLSSRWRGLGAFAAVGLVCALLSACTGEQFQKGYILPPGALEQIPIGASQDQVLIVMGTPSTVAT